MRTNKNLLAYLLRHDKNYNFEAGGWRTLADLCQRHSFTFEEIVDIVVNDDKGRFELNYDEMKVRALYGHSVEVDLLLRKQKPPKTLLHGTAVKYIESIRQNGLRPKSRRYVHMTEDIDIALKTGSRHGEAVLLKIDAQSMSDNGYVFYSTKNGTWLTNEVPIKYIKF